MDTSFSTTCTPRPVRVDFGNCPTCFPGALEIAALALCCLTAATAWAAVAVAVPVGDIVTWQAAPPNPGDVTLDDGRDDAPGGIASNLLVDPSFENNPLGSYSTVLTNWVTGVWGAEAAAITGPVGGVVPPHGARMLRMVNDGLIYTQVVQITNVAAHAAQIDSGVVGVSLSAMLNAGSGVASAMTYVRAAFYTGPSVALPNGMTQQTATLDDNHTTWETLSTSGPVPPGTRWLVTEFGFQNNSIAGSAGYVDATDLTLILPVCQGNETVIEVEPNCGIPVDTVNGGCNSVPQVFGSLTCGQTVCGTYAFDGAMRDTDWYKFNTCATGDITWTVTAQDPFQGLIIVDGDGDPCNFDCATLAVIAFAQPPAGVPGVSFAAAAPADGYVVWAGPQFSGLPPCGREYRAVLECSGCVTPPCPPCPPCPPAGPTYRSSYLILGDPNNVPWSWRLSDPLFCAEDLCVPGVSLGDDLDSDGCSGTPADVARRFADSINQYSAVNGCFFRLFALVEPLYSLPNPCPIGAILHIDHQSATAPALRVGSCGDPNCPVVFCLPACGCPFNPTIYKIEWSGQDCNGNGRDDILDVLLGSSVDVNANGVPDECESTHAFGLPHVALGQATLAFDPNSGQLVIGNIGDGGQDGVAVQLGAAGSASLGWAEIQASPPGGRIVYAVHGSIAGMPQQELAVANIEHDGSTWTITHDLSNLGVSDYEYVVFNGPSVVMTIAANSATFIEVSTPPHLGAIGGGGGGGGGGDDDTCYWQQKFPCNDPNWYCSSGWDPNVRCFKVPALEQGMCCCKCDYYFGSWDWFDLLPILVHSPNGPVLVDGTAIGVRLPLPAAWDGPLNLSELRVTVNGIPELRIASEGVGYEGILASALGQAHLTCSNAQIAVSNIGQAGFHGVAFGLQGLTRVGASIAIDPNLLPDLPQDAVPVRYALSAADTGEETCLEFWCAKNTMRIQACDDDTCVQLRLNGSLVLSRTANAGEEIATTPMYWSHSGAFISGGVMWQYYRWSPAAEFTVPGAGVVLADELRFRRCVPIGPVGTFDELTVRAAALPAFLVTGLGVLAPCPADLSGDRVIDQSDLGILLGNWNCKGRPGDCPGDVNGDGAVDQADLGELLARFSQVCD